jgi:dimethylargininase
MNHALVRPPGASFARAISSSGIPIDVALARAQHREYCAALTEAGLSVEALPPDERYPDSCFVQDPVIIFGGIAVMCRHAAPSRQGEEEALAAALAGRLPLTRIVPPGFIEGGDVLCLPDRILVGRSERTNRAGVAQLAVALAASGLPIMEVPVGRYLHLLSVATYLGRNTLLVAADFSQQPAFAGLELLLVPPAETAAANVLVVGDTVILPAGYPLVAGMLADQGRHVLPVPVGEFAKADGGVTCLSLVW